MLIDNTLFLRERFPKIRKYFSEHEDEIQLNRLRVLASKSGAETIQYQTEENKQLMVHSMYDPMREAERIIASHQEKITNDTHVFFYGIGMGYHIEKFQELYPNNSYSAYEPVPEIFLAMTNHKLLNRMITKNTKQLYVDTHEDDSLDHLLEFNTSNRNIHLIILPSYENIVKEKIARFRENIKKVILNRRTSLHTNANFQKLWVSNSLLNFQSVLNTPNMMKDIEHTQFAGKPALIVSAGPSLAEDIEHIRYIKENNLAYIFSVGSAINSLIAYDVMPDAVCTYDPGKLNHKVFEKMIDNGIDDIPMLFGSSVGYETLEKYQGPKVHFITTQDRTSTFFLKDQLNIEQDLIIDSPSIAVMTFQVLNKLGADPIFFAGQNLGYLYDRLYSEGIDYDHIQSEVDKEKLEKALKTEDVYGNEIKTSIGFNNMRESIENFARQYRDKTFINTTKGGAAIEGVPFQPIEEVIEKILTQPLEKDGWWDGKSDYDQSNIEKQQNELEHSIRKFYDHISGFEALLNTIDSYTKLRNKQKIGSSLTQFDRLYMELTENIYYRHFLSFYIRVHVEFMANEIKRLNQERDPYVKGKEVVKLFRDFIRQCKQGGAELEQVITSINQ